jgi:hypothetical protein
MLSSFDHGAEGQVCLHHRQAPAPSTMQSQQRWRTQAYLYDNFKCPQRCEHGGKNCCT